MHHVLLLLVLSLILAASAADVTQQTTSVRGKIAMQSHLISSETTVALDEGKYSAFVRGDGTFEIFNVPAGKYAVDIDDALFSFPKYKIHVAFKKDEDDQRSKTKIKAIKYAFPGAPKESVKYPLVIEPVGRANYFEIRQGYNIWSILRSPTVLMMLPMLGLLFCFKFLVDPEEIKRMQQEQAEEAAKVARQQEKAQKKKK